MKEFSAVMGHNTGDFQILPGPVVGQTFRQASRYCTAVGKRLPGEFEWEAASSRKEFVCSNVSKWTSSWYQSYPGNQQVEAECGTRFWVRRGSDTEGKFDLYLRSFMAADERSLENGFCCAETDSQ